MASENFSIDFTDEADMSLFKPLGNDVANLIIRIKRNDPTVKRLKLNMYRANLDMEARLGHILGHNSYLEELDIINQRNSSAVLKMFIGIQNNVTITKFSLSGLDVLRESSKMVQLVPFLASLEP